VEFSSHNHFYKLSRSWLLLGMCHMSCLLPLACLFTVPRGIALPLFFGIQGAPPSLLCVILLLLIIIQFFFFFPWVGVSLSRIWSDQINWVWSGPGLSVEVPCAT
jgi:hypothetical protein